MPGALQELRPFSLEAEIGQLPQDEIIYSYQEKEGASLDVTLDDFHTRIVLKRGSENFDMQTLGYLYGLTRTVDNLINRSADRFPFVTDSISEGETRALVKLHSKEQMVGVQNEFIHTLLEGQAKLESKSGRKTVMALPMWGSLAIFRALEKQQVPTDRLIAADISGSLGTDTGHAEIGELSKELTNPDNIVVFPDDIYDTCVTLEQLAMARLKKKSEVKGVRVKHDIYEHPEKFEEQIRMARRGELDPSESQQVWHDLAEVLWEVDIISAPFSIKNPPFAKAVIGLAAEKWAEPTTSEWDRQKAAIQMQMIAQTHYINPDHWIIGGMWDGVPLLDTKIRGRSIVQELRLNREEYSLTDEQLDEFEKTGINELSLRAFSGLDGLWIFNPDNLDGAEAYNLLIRYFAGNIAGYIQSRWIQ
jgi:hypothetical protein